MSDDFFTQPEDKQRPPTGRDPREYPDDWVFGKTEPPPSAGRSARSRPPHVGAVLLILAGVLFFLNNTGILHVGSIFEYWPLILIAVGVSKLGCSRGRGLAQVWAIMVIAIGGLFLAHNFGVVGLNFGFLWPVGLIGAGLFLLMKRSQAGASIGRFPNMIQHPHFDEREVHLFSFFGGVKRVMDTDDFRGGEALAIFGGVELDLRLARLSGGVKEVVIDANAMFGGVNIKVPDNWRVAVRGIGMFGGYVDKTLRRRSDVNPDSPLLIVTGYAAFGGIEVQS